MEPARICARGCTFKLVLMFLVSSSITCYVAFWFLYELIYIYYEVILLKWENFPIQEVNQKVENLPEIVNFSKTIWFSKLHQILYTVSIVNFSKTMILCPHCLLCINVLNLIQGFLFVAGLTRLESLNINCCNCITDSDMKPLAGMSALSYYSDRLVSVYRKKHK